MQDLELLSLVIDSLEEMKAKEIKIINVQGLTSVTDTMVIASGTSNRQVKSIAGRVIQRAKEAGVPPIGTEGEAQGEWVLVDLGDVVLHVMLPKIRDFYQLERLWEVPSEGQIEKTEGQDDIRRHGG